MHTSKLHLQQVFNIQQKKHCWAINNFLTKSKYNWTNILVPKSWSQTNVTLVTPAVHSPGFQWPIYQFSAPQVTYLETGKAIYTNNKIQEHCTHGPNITSKSACREKTTTILPRNKKSSCVTYKSLSYKIARTTQHSNTIKYLTFSFYNYFSVPLSFTLRDNPFTLINTFPHSVTAGGYKFLRNPPTQKVGTCLFLPPNYSLTLLSTFGSETPSIPEKSWRPFPKS